MIDRWHFRCYECGAYGDGNRDYVEWLLGNHEHNAEVWERGKRNMERGQ